jgi:hypothetical protein
MLIAGSSLCEATFPQQDAAARQPGLTARVSRWQGDPVKKRKGPEGFDLQFRLVGSRFDGTFGIEGLPQTVPEGETFEVQVRLTNIGPKAIKISGVTVTGDGATLPIESPASKIEGKSTATIASFKVPPQTSAGSTFLITVVQGNGDKHTASLSFSPRS